MMTDTPPQRLSELRQRDTGDTDEFWSLCEEVIGLARDLLGFGVLLKTM